MKSFSLVSFGFALCLSVASVCQAGGGPHDPPAPLIVCENGLSMFDPGWNGYVLTQLKESTQRFGYNDDGDFVIQFASARYLTRSLEQGAVGTLTLTQSGLRVSCRNEQPLPYR